MTIKQYCFEVILNRSFFGHFNVFKEIEHLSKLFIKKVIEDLTNVIQHI